MNVKISFRIDSRFCFRRRCTTCFPFMLYPAPAMTRVNTAPTLCEGFHVYPFRTSTH